MLGMSIKRISVLNLCHVLKPFVKSTPGHENISTAILPLPLIQEEQFSVTGKRMCT